MTSHDVMTGALWGLGAATFHSFVPIAVRFLEHIPSIELVLFRNVIGLSLFLSIVGWRGFGFLRTQRIGFHFQRNLANFIGMWLWFAGLALLPVAKAVALHFTVPLMVVVLAWIFLRERPGGVRLTMTLIGFAGVLVILRPGTVEIGPAAFLVLGSALAYAGVAIFTRSLGRTDHPSTTSFYYQSMVSVFAAVSMLGGWFIATRFPDAGVSIKSFTWVMPTVADIPALLLLSVAGTVAPYCLVRAFIHAEATIVEPIEYLRLPISAGIAYLVFSQTTDVWVWVGAAVIAASTLYMTRHETRKAEK
jgi:drug/metabolite transporter (DMT)-like permease